MNIESIKNELCTNFEFLFELVEKKSNITEFNGNDTNDTKWIVSV